MLPVGQMLALGGSLDRGPVICNGMRSAQALLVNELDQLQKLRCGHLSDGLAFENVISL
jgi:hypothetical protein